MKPAEGIALHGFLGLPEDWKPVQADLHYKFNAVNLYSAYSSPPSMGDLPGLSELADQILANHNSAGWIMGYSLGGRIALHCLTSPLAGSVRTAVIVSGGLGLADDDPNGRKERLASDAKWANRFQNEPWDTTVKSWNQLPVFQNDPPETEPVRNENQFCKQALTSLLTATSLAHQWDMRKQLPRLEIPVLFIAGEWDSKYAGQAGEAVTLNSKFELAIISGAGHRVHLSHPNELADAVNRFLDKKL